MAFESIDAWFEKGFQIRRQRAATVRRDRVRAQCGQAPSSNAGVRFSSGAKQANIKKVIQRAPEVMVKITGNSSGMASARRHLDYISRNGQVELTDECGGTVQGKDGLRDLREQLKASQIPLESDKREFLHVVFSMPAGTPAAGTKDAVLQFCQEEFANRRYAVALHDDTDHTHVHVFVGTRDIDRADEPRLSPRKADLFRWRQGFADKLRDNGIEAAASERRHRFQQRRPEKGSIRQMRSENPASPVFNARRAATKAQSAAMRAAMGPGKGPVPSPAKKPPRKPRVLAAQRGELQEALRTGRRPTNPHADEIGRSKAGALAGWAKVAKDLVGSGEIQLARQVADLMQQGQKPSQSRAQELYDLATTRNKNQEHER